MTLRLQHSSQHLGVGEASVPHGPAVSKEERSVVALRLSSASATGRALTLTCQNKGCWARRTAGPRNQTPGPGSRFSPAEEAQSSLTWNSESSGGWDKMHFKAMSPTKMALRSIPHMQHNTCIALPNFVERQGARDPSCRDFLHDLSTSITLVDKLDDLSRSR